MSKVSYNLKVTKLIWAFTIIFKGKNRPHIRPTGEGEPKSKNKYKSVKHKAETVPTPWITLQGHIFQNAYPKCIIQSLQEILRSHVLGKVSCNLNYPAVGESMC